MFKIRFIRRNNYWRMGLLLLIILIRLGGYSVNAANWSGWHAIPGKTLARPWLYADTNRLLAAIQGLDAKAYSSEISGVGSWRSWKEIGDSVAGGPVVIEYNGRTYAFIRGSNGYIYYSFKTADFWLKWLPMGIAALSAPTVTVYNGCLDLAVRGQDNQVYLNTIKRSGRIEGKWRSIGGYTESEPFIGVKDDHLTVVIRGAGNKILLNTKYDEISWNGWHEVPGKQRTPSGPAFIQYRNKLFLTVRGMNNSVWFNTCDQGAWSNWEEIGGATPNTPAIAGFGNNIYLMVRGMDNRIYVKEMKFDSFTYPGIGLAGSWSGWSRYPDGQTSSGPGAAVYDGILYTMVRSMDNGIYFKTGLNYGWTKINGATLSNPALAEFNGNLFALIRGTDNGIYLNRFNGSWQNQQNLDGTTLSGGSLASYDGRLYATIRGVDNGIYINSMNSEGGWSGWVETGGTTNAEPGMTVYDNRIYLAVRGLDDRIYLRYFNGIWSEWSVVPGNRRILSGPVLVKEGRNLRLIVRSDDNKIYSNILNSGGNWNGWAEIPGGGRTDSSPGAVLYQNALRIIIKGLDNYIYFNSNVGGVIPVKNIITSG